MDQSIEYVKWFRNSAPYINSHKGKTFVVLFGGDAVADPNFPNVVHDLALLNSLGVRLVLIHGARPQIEERANLRGVASKFHNNVRVTDEDMLATVIDAVGSVRSDIESQFSMGIANSPMHGAQIRVISGNFVTAKPRGVIDGVDHELSGEVRKVHAEPIRQQLDLGNIVLLSPLGYSPTGEVFNLYIEDLAVACAATISADKLIVLSGNDGLVDDEGYVVDRCNLAEARELISEPGLRHAVIGACMAGISRNHIVCYKHDGAILQELFSREGRGTLVTTDPYERLRIATIDDVGGILELIKPLEQQGVLVRRSRELLETEIDHFSVIEFDGMIIGCAALHLFEGQSVAELACITVHPDYRDSARGDDLLEHIINRAKPQGVDRLFVLTTRTAHWFRERGFEPIAIQDLPPAKQALYNFQRNSKAFAKTL